MDSADNAGDEAVSARFEIRHAPAVTDIDELGHVGNLTWLRYVIDAARAHSVAVGLDHQAYARIGAVFVVRRHVIDYLAPAFAGEELVTTTFIANFRAATSERRTRVAGADGRDRVRAVTTWAFVAIDTGRPRRIPNEVIAAFAADARVPVDK